MDNDLTYNTTKAPHQPWKIQQNEAVGPQVYSFIRSRIIHIDLIPGTLISESEVARTLSLSRQPVREAFIKLAEEGLVEVRPQRGTMIRKISKSAVLDARFVREAIEADVAKQLALSGDASVVAQLRMLIQQQRAVEKENHSQFMKLDEEFHKTLADAAGNSYAWKVVESVKAQMDRVRYLSTFHYSVVNLIDQHEAIVDAIELKKPRDADKHMRNHLKEIVKSLPGIALAQPDFFEE